MNKKKLVWALVVVLALIGLAYGYREYNRGPVDIRSAEAIRLKATELYTAFANDSAAAGKKYSGKILELTGEVNASTTETGSRQIILLQSGLAGASVNCTMENISQAVQPGQTITLRGMVTGMGETDDILGIPGDVYLDRCILMNQ